MLYRFVISLLIGLFFQSVLTQHAAHGQMAEKTASGFNYVQVAEINLNYTDLKSMTPRRRGRLLYWNEGDIRLYARLDDMMAVANASHSRCAFQDPDWRESLAVTLSHIPQSGREVDLKRHFRLFIIGTLTNSEINALSKALAPETESWKKSLQDTIRITASDSAYQAMQCLAIKGDVAVQEIETEVFHDRLFWRMEDLADGSRVKYFFVAKTFFAEQEQ